MWMAEYEAPLGDLTDGQAALQHGASWNFYVDGAFHVTSLVRGEGICKAGARPNQRGILPNMLRFGCFWVRPRVERLADGALEGWAARSVAAHLGWCAECQAVFDKTVRLKAFVRQAMPVPAGPDWSGFWPAVQARLAREESKPIRESWWLPLWKPVWGHPRLAFGSALLAVLVAGFSLWPADDAAFASSVTVQDVFTHDDDRSVMVYSSRKEGVTVIWVFPSNQGYDPDGDAP